MNRQNSSVELPLKIALQNALAYHGRGRERDKMRVSGGEDQYSNSHLMYVSFSRPLVYFSKSKPSVFFMVPST